MNTESYPTSFDNMVREMVSLGFHQLDIVQSAEFLKGRAIGKREPVTQTLRNRTLNLLENNNAPRG